MRRIAYFLLLLLVLSGCPTRDKVEVKFPVRQPDPNQVAQLLGQEKREISGFQPGDTEKRVLDAYIQFNRNAMSRGKSQTDLEQDIARIRSAARVCLEQDGQKRLRQLIAWLLSRFERSLAELMTAAQTQKAAAALLSGAPPPEDIREKFKNFTELGGDFIQNAYKAGLVRSSKKGGLELVEGGQFFVRLAFKVRWAMILPEGTQPLSWLLNGFESEWYDIWTVERSLTAPLSRKLKAIVSLKKRNPAYRDHTARGIVYYQHENFSGSVKSFDQALQVHPQDQQLHKFKKAAQRHSQKR